MRISDWSSDVCSSDLPAPSRFNVRSSRRSPDQRFNAAANSGRALTASNSVNDDRSFTASTSPKISTGRSEEHTSELQSLMRISYAVFCLKKKTTTIQETQTKNDHTLTRLHINIARVN